MERFFLLDKFNTWYDWRSILTAKDVTPPEPKTNNVEMDGMNGSLDLSESLSGEITYNDRTVSASFWTDAGTYKEREDLLNAITANVHGRKINIVEPDTPDKYFYGRVKIKSRNNTLPYAEYSIEATCEPWRYSLSETERRVDVNSGIITRAVITNSGVKTLCPLLTVTGKVNISYEGIEITLTEGSYKFSDIKLYKGVNIIGVSGKGSIIFTYREATL